jgi:hypothetical protein
MSLDQQLISHLASVISHILDARQMTDDHRQEVNAALARLTASGKTWFELITWKKFGNPDLCNQNDAAFFADIAWSVLMDDPYRLVEHAETLAQAVRHPQFWQWCQDNTVAFVPARDGDYMIVTLADRDTFYRLYHEYVVMLREVQNAALS